MDNLTFFSFFFTVHLKICFNLGEAKIKDKASWNQGQVYNGTSNSCHNAALFGTAQPVLVKLSGVDDTTDYIRQEKD